MSGSVIKQKLEVVYLAVVSDNFYILKVIKLKF